AFEACGHPEVDVELHWIETPASEEPCLLFHVTRRRRPASDRSHHPLKDVQRVEEEGCTALPDPIDRRRRLGCAKTFEKRAERERLSRAPLAEDREHMLGAEIEANLLRRSDLRKAPDMHPLLGRWILGTPNGDDLLTPADRRLNTVLLRHVASA